MKILKAGLVGCGRIGCETRKELKDRLPHGWIPLSHADAIVTQNEVSFHCASDPDEIRQEYVQKQYQIQHVYADYTEMFEQNSIDILCIATRVKPRLAIIDTALKFGIRAFHIEKPLANSVQNSEAIIKKLLASEALVTFGTTRRFMDIFIHAKKLIQSGEIGDLLQVSVNFGQELLYWVHPHSIDIMLYLSGAADFEYVQASCKIDAFSKNDHIVDCDPYIEYATIKFDNGVIGSVTSIGGMNVIIAGSKGNIEILGDGKSLSVHYSDPIKGISHVQYAVIPEASGTSRAIKQLAESLKGSRKELGITLEDISINQKILTAITQSSLENGNKVTMASLDKALFITGKFGENYA